MVVAHESWFMYFYCIETRVFEKYIHRKTIGVIIKFNRFTAIIQDGNQLANLKICN